MRSAFEVTLAVRPCLDKFRLARFLPPLERGPVLFRTLGG